MNKKEVSEIRRQYVPERCTISRICGCYVDGEKNVKTTLKEAFLSIPEEDAFKYFTIFKKTLSGSIGRNLINLDFPLEEEKEGGCQEFLLKLRDSKLKEDELIEVKVTDGEKDISSGRSHSGCNNNTRHYMGQDVERKHESLYDSRLWL